MKTQLVRGRVRAEPGLRIRKGPSPSEEAISTLPNGTIVDVIDRAGEWVHVRFKEHEGFVLAQFIDLQNAEENVRMSGPRLLRRGMSGTSVSEVQQRLVAAGYDLAIDGEFGPDMTKAVRDFQGKHGLTVDGIVGPKTAQAMQEVSHVLSGTISLFIAVCAIDRTAFSPIDTLLDPPQVNHAAQDMESAVIGHLQDIDGPASADILARWFHLAGWAMRGRVHDRGQFCATLVALTEPRKVLRLAQADEEQLVSAEDWLADLASIPPALADRISRVASDIFALVAECRGLDEPRAAIRLHEFAHSIRAGYLPPGWSPVQRQAKGRTLALLEITPFDLIAASIGGLVLAAALTVNAYLFASGDVPAVKATAEEPYGRELVPSIDELLHGLPEELEQRLPEQMAPQEQKGAQ